MFWGRGGGELLCSRAASLISFVLIFVIIIPWRLVEKENMHLWVKKKQSPGPLLTERDFRRGPISLSEAPYGPAKPPRGSQCSHMCNNMFTVHHVDYGSTRVKVILTQQ